MLKWVKNILVGSLIALVLAATLPSGAHAAVYGSGKYNSCTYSCAASSSQQTTNVTLPSGLVVTVNLHNGQKVPQNGYVVIVQPAAGQTGTLKSVSFYMNGQLQFTGTPNDTGAVRWLWQPGNQSGDIHIKLVITGADGSVSTQEYTVTIGTPDTPTAAPTTTEEKTDVVSTISRAVLGFVGTLPAPVLYGLPYFLFGLLLLNIILLLVQTQREIHEVTVLQHIIELERKTGLEKNAFVSLASHYLRTPISIIQGGFDLLKRSATIPPEVSANAQAITESLRLKIDSLLTRSDAAGQLAGSATGSEQLPSAWKNPGLYLPILLIGLFALAFDYVVSHVQSFDVNQLNIILQVVAFALLAVVFYQVFRRRQLRRRDTQGMQRALAHEQAINQTRDELIAESTNLLGGDLQSLKTITDTLPPGQALDFIKDGVTRFRSVLVKFAIAGQLRGGRAGQPDVTTSLKDVLAGLPPTLTGRLAQKGVQLNLAADAAFATKNPQLVTYVLASLIDNSAEYSNAQTTIDVQGQTHADGMTISITDHGAGISPEKMSLLFRPFSQTQDVERFTHEGMGFSLYLDKLIMTYLGGSIDLISKPGVQTVATLHLPS